MRNTAALAHAGSSHSYFVVLCFILVRDPETRSRHEEPHMTDPRFPIGKFHDEGRPSEDQRRKFIAEIEHTPTEIRAAVQGLSPEQLDTPYRDGGWNVRQVVHHVPESHMNAYIRFKLGLTEDNPTIKPYEEGRWAK